MLKDLGRSVFIYGIASSISKFVGIFLIPIFSRCFSATEYGTLDVISTVFSFVAIFGMMQLESAISRYYYEVEGDERKVYISTAFWTISILSVVFQLIIIALADILSTYLFTTAAYGFMLKVGSFNILLLNLFGYLTVVLRFHNRPILYAIVVFSQFFITATVSVVLIFYFKTGIMAFFIGQIAGLLVGVIIMLAYLRKSFVLIIRLSVLREFFRYAIPQVPAVAGNWLNSYANRFVMLTQLTVSDVGIYTVGLKIASIFNLFDNAFRMAWEPYLWERIKLPNHKELLRTLSIITSIAVFSVALLLMLFAEELILILSTKQYMAALPIIKILIFAFTFPILTQVFGAGTSIAKKTIYNTISFFVGVSLNLSLMFVLVPRIGLIGVPLSLSVSNLSTLFLMWYFSEKKYYIGYNYKLVTVMILLFSLLAYVLFTFEINFLVKIFFVLVIVLIAFLNKNRIYSFLASRF